MTDVNSGSGSTIPPNKGIGSLAKKQVDVTRQGAQKLKFVPTLPGRRKKEEIKAEPAVQVAPATPTASRGRGRGRGRGEDRGRGRGMARLETEMTASGPFAMGPALAGSSARRTATHSNIAPIMPPSRTSTSLGSDLTSLTAPSLQSVGLKGKGKGDIKRSGDSEEVYSDPDEGVEILDMEDVHEIDWMAPESLKKERHIKRMKKEEAPDNGVIGEVNNANALDLSESEEEEELEDIIEYFAMQSEGIMDPSLHEEKLYFFQFPSPFPTFLSKTISPPPPIDIPVVPDLPGKKVAFAKDVKSDLSSSKNTEAQNEADSHQVQVDGVIGYLETYRSGAVKMRLTNGILLDVTAATQPSFLQQAVHLDLAEKRLNILGEVNRRFSVSPDVETLLTAMEMADQTPITDFDGEGLIQMELT